MTNIDDVDSSLVDASADSSIGEVEPTISSTTTTTTIRSTTTTTTTIATVITKAAGDATTTTSSNTSATSVAKRAGSAASDEAIFIPARCAWHDKHPRFNLVGCGTKIRSDISCGDDELFRNYRWARKEFGYRVTGFTPLSSHHVRARLSRGRMSGCRYARLLRHCQRQ